MSGLSDTGASDISGDGSAEILPDSLTILCWNIGYAPPGGGRMLEADLPHQRGGDAARGLPRLSHFPGVQLQILLCPHPPEGPHGTDRQRSGPDVPHCPRGGGQVAVFNLKRCLLTATFRLADGSSIVIGNTHNTAYDTGGMRTAETRWLGGLTARFAGRTDRPPRLGGHPLHHRRRLEPVSARLHPLGGRNRQPAFYHRRSRHCPPPGHRPHRLGPLRQDPAPPQRSLRPGIRPHRHRLFLHLP